MALKHLIIHVVKRDADGEPLTKQLRPKENVIGDVAKKLTDGLLDLFSSASLNIGEFGIGGDNDLEPPFEQRLKQYYDENLNCTDFVALTKALSEDYEGILKHKQLNTVKGGYLAFYQYEVRHQKWLAIAILNKTDGIDVSKQLDVVPSQVLDLKKLHLGAAINLTQWQSDLTTRYVRFRTGLAAEVREYFEEFIGCQRDKEGAIQETKQLKDAIRNFAKVECNLDDEQISQKVAAAHDFIIEQQKAGREVRLSHIANRVFPDKSELFVKEAKEKYDLSEDIAIHKTTLRSYKKISARGNGLSISFDRELLGKQIKFENDKLIITELPHTLLEALEEEQAARNIARNN